MEARPLTIPCSFVQETSLTSRKYFLFPRSFEMALLDGGRLGENPWSDA